MLGDPRIRKIFYKTYWSIKSWFFCFLNIQFNELLFFTFKGMWGAERIESISIVYTRQVPIQEVIYKKGEGAADQHFDHQSHVNFNPWPQVCLKSLFQLDGNGEAKKKKAVIYWHVENYKINLKCIHLNSWSQTYSMWLIALYTLSDVGKVMFLFPFGRKLSPSQLFISPSSKFLKFNRH